MTYILILLVTIIISITFILFFRHEVNVFNVGPGHECMIRTNLFTGKSCYIAGSSACTGSMGDLNHDHDYDDIPYCVSMPN